MHARVERITDAGDPRLGDYRDLGHAGRMRRDTFIVESRLLVRKLLASRFRPRSILATRSALADLDGALADEACVYLADGDTIRKVVGFGFHHGCLAVAERGAPLALEGLLAPQVHLLVALEGVTNPDNVGGIFRNASAFGASGVLLSPGCGDPLYRKAARVAMGGSLEVPFAHAPDWPEALARLKAAGFTLVALTPDVRAVELGALRVPGRVALVLGAEGEGLAAGTRAAADVEARVGMANGADSLNVATASGIALYRFRQLVRVVP